MTKEKRTATKYWVKYWGDHRERRVLAPVASDGAAVRRPSAGPRRRDPVMGPPRKEAGKGNLTMRKRKRRYPRGTILKNTEKAIRLHPNHFSAGDRYRVTGPTTAE